MIVERFHLTSRRQVWYTSLAFGGFGSSKADVQSAHLLTEEMLRK